MLIALFLIAALALFVLDALPYSAHRARFNYTPAGLACAVAAALAYVL